MLPIEKRQGSPIVTSVIQATVLGLLVLSLTSPRVFLNLGISHLANFSSNASPDDASVTTFPKGQLSSSLYLQYLSHHALHFSRLPTEIAALSTDSNASEETSVVVIGVEFGMDVKRFADEGHNVIAFEPMPIFFNRVTDMVRLNRQWNVTLHNVAAGNSSGVMDIEYRAHSLKVDVVRIDDMLNLNDNHQVSVMTIDVQGFEYNVLQGSINVLKYVQVLWFEAFACNKDVDKIMSLLDDDFVLFDFVPVGHFRNSTTKGYKERENFLFDADRPSAFVNYLDWFCAFKEGDYYMVQTDILAIRRDLVLSLAPKLSNISERACAEDISGSNRCLLRNMMKRK